MRRFFSRMSVVFSAGALGGLINSLVVWYFGSHGIPAALGVKLAPALTTEWLYPRIVWGGIWGILFLLPLLRGSVFFRGFLFSLGPTAVQLFYIFPMVAGKGVWGMQLGLMTPLLVVFYNVVWGITAALWVKGVQE